MFERYTERARRTLFFSRYEASQYGNVSILPEHVLLGLIRESKGPIARIFAAAGLPLEDVRAYVERIRAAESIPVSVEIPFAESTKHLLLHAAEEADALSHSSIAAPHLLLGLLRLDSEPLVAYLTEHGVTLASTREHVAKDWIDEESMAPGER